MMTKFIDIYNNYTKTGDINKLKIIKKDIKDKVDNTIISSLYCELYYENEIIPLTGNLTDLRMSRLYFENVKKDEQNDNK